MKESLEMIKLAPKDGVPIPEKSRGIRTSKYEGVFKQLLQFKIGQSDVLPFNSKQMASLMSYMRKKTQFKFTSRRMSEDQFRIWRTA